MATTKARHPSAGEILHHLHIAEHALHAHVSLHHHHRVRPEHPTALKANPWLTLVVLTLGFFMVLLDTTIVSVAIPRIVDGLNSSLDEVLWVVNAYVLVFAVLLLPAGRLGDIYGERTMFALGVVVFTAASVMCGLSQNGSELIIGRALQGVGGALLTPQTIAIVVAVFPPGRRGAAFGVWGAVAGAAAIIGPALGGLIVTYSSWRVVFFMNLPVGIATVALMFFWVPNIRGRGQQNLDPIGILLAGVGLFSLIFGLIEGPRYAWGTILGPLSVPVALVAGCLFLAAFLIWEHYQEQPLVPLSMFANRNYSLMNWVGAVMEFAILGFFTPLTIYYQSVLGFSARDAGLSVSPLPLAAMFLAPVAGILADKLGGKYILAVGLSLFALGTAWFAWSAQIASSWVALVPSLVVAGVGMGCIFAPLGAMAMQDIPTSAAATASAIINTTRQLGAVAGGAVIGAVLQASLAASLQRQAVARSGEVPDGYRSQFVSVFSRSSGLDVGPHQHYVDSLSAAAGPDAANLARVAHEVFVYGFVDAMRPTVTVAAAIVAAAALTCLFIRRSEFGAVETPAEPAAEEALA